MKLSQLLRLFISAPLAVLVTLPGTLAVAQYDPYLSTPGVSPYDEEEASFIEGTDEQTEIIDAGDLNLDAEELEELKAFCQNYQATSYSSNPFLAPLQVLANLQAAVVDQLQTWGTELVARANAAPWPNIHARAQMARVPVMMYHDILPEKEVFFDVTIDELEADFQMIRDNGLTPITLDELVLHLRTGLPLPEKPILLSFDDGYVGHYEHVYRLMQEYNYPAVFSVFTAKPDGDIVGRSTLTWEQIREMAADPLVTIAAHSVNHPRNLTELTDEDLVMEITRSKDILERQIGQPIRYFTYPEGHYDERVAAVVQAAGYEAAFTMDDFNEQHAGASESLLAIARFGQSRLEEVLDDAWGGPSAPKLWAGFDFTAPVVRNDMMIGDMPLLLITGGKPFTIHADSRYQLPEMMEGTPAIAAVDGGFFSLEFLDSNVMIGPVYSRMTGEFVPGSPGENPLLNGRPLVLISDDDVKFIPFDADKHNSLEGVRAEMPDVKDAFVGAAFLVRSGQPQPYESFGNLFDFDAARYRAFWGINEAGQPVVGNTDAPIGSVGLGEVLSQAGFRDAVMLDSGASTSLAFEGESIVGYIPRPVPHAVALEAPKIAATAQYGGDERCAILSQDDKGTLKPGS